MVLHCVDACRLRLSLKKILFPVQWVAKIKASRAAAIFSSFFSHSLFFCKIEKKSLQSHLFEPPGRSTGNRIIFMDSLMLHCVAHLSTPVL